MKNLRIYLASLVAVLCSLNARALELDEKVPFFKSLDERGKTWDSQKISGKKLILIYFYPAAMTGGCTKQACAFRDDKSKWTNEDVEVIGVSGDRPENLVLFKNAENLNFTLLSDPEGKIAKIFGIPTGKGGSIDRFVKGEKFTLNRGVTTKRWTFLISKEGKLIYKNDKVQAAQDSSTVLDFLKKVKKT